MHPLRRNAMLTRPLLRAVPAALVAAACGAQAERGGCGGGVTCPAADLSIRRGSPRANLDEARGLLEPARLAARAGAV